MSALQQNQEWFDKRIGCITGSRVGAILGFSPYSNADKVLREMVREYYAYEREFTGNVATEWGNNHEDEAIAAYEAETGSLVISTGFVPHPEHGWLGASPDGLIGTDGLLETKCPYSQKITPISERADYYAQIQLQLACTGRQWCDFYTWTPNGTSCERVLFDKDWLPDVLPVLDEFYQRYALAIEAKTDNPHLQPLEAERTDAAWTALEMAYSEAQQKADEAKAELDKAKQALIEAADGIKSRGGMYMAYPVRKEGSISYAKVVKDHCKDIDLAPYKGKATESWTIRKVGEK